MDTTKTPIVFIQMGSAPPPYLATAVKQARKWNPTAPIVCISSVVEDYCQGETWVDIAHIPISVVHARFKTMTLLPGMDHMNGFWQLTTERLFVLEDWMRWAGIEECFHLENDNMLYQDISEIQPLLKTVSPGLLTTFQGQGETSDALRVCFSVLYCSSVGALSRFTFYLASSASSIDEMRRGGLYWQDTPDECAFLPTAPVGTVLKSEKFRGWIEDGRFSGIIFDSTTHGQYLGGADPRYSSAGPGFVNPDCDFQADQFHYTWGSDELGRRYPVIADSGGRPLKIANLHIHCKRLHEFL